MFTGPELLAKVKELGRHWKTQPTCATIEL
jgi:hypothetical protein